MPPQLGNYLDSINPANGNVEINVPDSTSEDVDIAVEAAAKAFETWSQTNAEYRLKLRI